MTTIRVERRTRYTVVDRRAVNDDRLSFRARGLLLWLLDKPDDWETNLKRLSLVGPDGIAAVRAAAQELEACGYLVRSTTTVAGRWHAEWVVREVPVDAAAPRAKNACGDDDDGVRKTHALPRAKTARITEPELLNTDTTTSSSRAKQAKPARKRAPVDVADDIAMSEWERRSPKPVCGFVAFRKRIGEALDAGHTAESVVRVLPTMHVFSRNAFDLALGKRTSQRRGVTSDEAQRTLAEGEVEL